MKIDIRIDRKQREQIAGGMVAERIRALGVPALRMQVHEKTVWMLRSLLE